MKLTQILADIICDTLLDPNALDRARRQKGAFTRNCRKLPYWTLVKLYLAMLKRQSPRPWMVFSMNSN